MGIARPDWCTLIERNITIILHGADDGAVAFGAGRVGVPDRIAIVVTAHNFINYKEALQNKTQHIAPKAITEMTKRGNKLTTCINCRLVA